MKSPIQNCTLILSVLAVFVNSCSIYSQETELNGENSGAHKASNGQHEHTNALKKETSPLPVNARSQSGELVRLGGRSVRARQTRKKVDLPFHRLFKLSLVSRDGTRILHG